VLCNWNTTAYKLYLLINVLCCISLSTPALAEKKPLTKDITPAQIEKKARAGDAESQYQLARYYDEGSGPFKKNVSTAYQWYLKAAKQGHIKAQYQVSQFYYYGEVVKPDFSLALRWLDKPLKSNYPPALRSLGLMYELGEGVKKDITKALFYYHKANDLEDHIAPFYLARHYEYGDAVNKNINRAFELYKLSADRGYRDAQVRTGEYYLEGKLVKQDYATALEYFTLAAQRNSTRGLFYTGWLYDEGFGTKENNEVAIILYEKAYKQGSSNAAYNIGYLYEFGDTNIEQDFLEAEKWYRKSLDAGNKRASKRLQAIRPLAEKARRRAEIREKYMVETIYLQETLQKGDQTHCGPVLEVMRPLAKIKTPDGLHWLEIEKLYPKNTSPCIFSKGVYIDPDVIK
jgi:TPR repeat protein